MFGLLLLLHGSRVIDTCAVLCAGEQGS